MFSGLPVLPMTMQPTERHLSRQKRFVSPPLGLNVMQLGFRLHREKENFRRLCRPLRSRTEAFRHGKYSLHPFCHQEVGYGQPALVSCTGGRIGKPLLLIRMLRIPDDEFSGLDKDRNRLTVRTDWRCNPHRSLTSYMTMGVFEFLHARY